MDNSKNKIDEELSLDDEYIYDPNKTSDEAIILSTEKDERFIRKVADKDNDYDDVFMSKQLDSILKTSIGRFSVLPIIGTVIGILLVIFGIITLGDISQRVIDNVVSGETIVEAIILLALGAIILVVSVIKLFNIKTPLSDLGEEIDNIVNDTTIKTTEDTDTDFFDEFNRNELEEDFKKLKKTVNPSIFKNKLKKSEVKKSTSKQSTLDEHIPQAKKIDTKEEEDYRRARLDTESIDDIFKDIEE